MIDELHVENVALIREATLEPAAGLTVLTGETGAGKTALLSALKLLVGERADAGAVREGADGLVVEGRFYLDGGAGDGPSGAQDENAAGEGMVVRRRVDVRGRGRVQIDGRMASVRELADGVGATVDLCGQHEHQRLLRQQTHVELLDAWAGASASEARARYVVALRAAHDAAVELERVRELTRSADARVDEAAFVLRRIDEVHPSVEELAELEQALPRAEHADALLRAAGGAHEILSDEGGALDTLGEAIAALEAASAYDDALLGYAQALQSALLDVEDVASDLRGYADKVDVDPAALDAMQTRIAAVRALLRTYGPTIDDVLAQRAAAAEVVEAARDGGAAVGAAEAAVRAAETELREAADALTAVRTAAAPQLAAAVTAEMAGLEMGSASVEVALESLPRAQWMAAGPVRVELLYRPSAGMSARPLRRIASGGEVSRVMLACKVVLGTGDAASTLVFDEVDAGVGGATALALGGVLARLAQSHQVIVVTHLAQVAVLAERHYVVRKGVAPAGDVPETTIVEVMGEERVAEVARMLSGDATQASLAHAREMLTAAGEPAR